MLIYNNPYLNLAFDTFLSYIFIPISSNYTLKVMLVAIANYNKFAIFFVVCLAKIFALLINISIGYIIYFLLRKYLKTKEHIYKIENTRQLIHKHCVWFIPIFSIISHLLIPFFSFFCGFLRAIDLRLTSIILIEVLSDVTYHIFF